MNRVEKASALMAFPPSPASGRGVGGEGREEVKPRPPRLIPADKLAFARQLRQQQTDAEQLFWGLLRNRRLKNAKFRRQYPIGQYILDFYCAEHSLVIELDGEQHGEQRAYDAQRDQWLSSQGLCVLRFWNNQVLQETEAVLTVIWDTLPMEKAPSPLAPLPLTGEGCEERSGV